MVPSFFFLPQLEVGVCLAVNYTAANSWSISTFSKLLSLFSEELEHGYKKNHSRPLHSVIVLGFVFKIIAKIDLLVCLLVFPILYLDLKTTASVIRY